MSTPQMTLVITRYSVFSAIGWVAWWMQMILWSGFFVDAWELDLDTLQTWAMVLTGTGLYISMMPPWKKVYTIPLALLNNRHQTNK